MSNLKTHEIFQPHDIIFIIKGEIEFQINKANGYYEYNSDIEEIEIDERKNYDIKNLIHNSKNEYTELVGFRTKNNRFIYFTLYETGKCYRQNKNNTIKISNKIFYNKFASERPDLVQELEEHYKNIQCVD